MASYYESSSCLGSIISHDGIPQLEPIKTLSVITDYDDNNEIRRTISSIHVSRISEKRSQTASRACNCTVF